MLAGKKTDERHMWLDFCAILQADKKTERPSWAL